MFPRGKRAVDKGSLARVSVFRLPVSQQCVGVGANRHLPCWSRTGLRPLPQRCLGSLVQSQATAGRVALDRAGCRQWVAVSSKLQASRATTSQRDRMQQKYRTTNRKRSSGRNRSNAHPPCRATGPIGPRLGMSAKGSNAEQVVSRSPSSDDAKSVVVGRVAGAGRARDTAPPTTPRFVLRAGGSSGHGVVALETVVPVRGQQCQTGPRELVVGTERVVYMRDRLRVSFPRASSVAPWMSETGWCLPSASLRSGQLVDSPPCI